LRFDPKEGSTLGQAGFAVLEKNELRAHLLKQWVILPQQSAAFVWGMDEIVDL
jgi:hypothetical protein